MLAKRLHIQLLQWKPYSEARGHELEWYLWFEGRQAFSLFDKGASDIVPAPGYFTDSRNPGAHSVHPMIYPLVVNNRFEVRLVALERDSPDPDDNAKAGFYIDLDTKYPPVSDWRIVASDPRNSDLNVEASFQLQWLDYVDTNEIPDTGVRRIVDKSNYPYPWGANVMVFEHWLGLGRKAALKLDDQNRASRREYWMINGNAARRMVQDVYRFNVNQLGVANDTISSVYVPKLNDGHVTVALYEHDFSDSRFAQGAKKSFGSVGLFNLRDTGFDDRVSSAEVIHTYPKAIHRDVHWGSSLPNQRAQEGPST